MEAKSKQIDEASSALDAMITPENAMQLAQLQSLVALNESLKRQEKAFKQTCKEHLGFLKAEIEKKVKEASGKEEEERIAQINETFLKDQEKMRKLKLLSAQKNRVFLKLFTPPRKFKWFSGVWTMCHHE